MNHGNTPDWLAEYGEKMTALYKNGWHSLPDPGAGKVCSFVEMETALAAQKAEEEAKKASEEKAAEASAPVFDWAPVTYDSAPVVSSGSYSTSVLAGSGIYSGSGALYGSGAYIGSGSYTGSGASAGMNMTAGVFAPRYTGSGYSTYAASYGSGFYGTSGFYTTSGAAATSGAYLTSGNYTGSHTGSGYYMTSGSYTGSGYYMTSGAYTGSGYYVTSGSYASMQPTSGTALTSGVPTSGAPAGKEEYDTTLKFSSYGLNLLL